jgi:undecaprenyl-diphosphatase
MKDNMPKEDERSIYSSRTVKLIIVLAAVCIILTLLLSIRELTDLDARLFLEAREDYETELKMFMRVFTELGSLVVWFPVVPLLWLIRKKEAAATLLVALFVVVVISISMKYAIERPRPFDVIQAVDPLYRPFDPSFPSGHAMTAFAGAVAVGRKWKKALIPLLILAAAVGFSRVYIGVHYPYDVASGALIGILIALVADSLNLARMIAWIDKKLHPLRNRLGR